MQYGLLAVLGAAAGAAVRRMIFLRRCGWHGAAHRLYRRTAWMTGLGVWCAMLLQEALLWGSGALSLRTGLPLHLCSLAGLITLPMLLTENQLLWHIALYAGMPGALLAILFPAVAQTPWPRLTALGFHAMHVLVFLAPLLPLGLGRRPEPSGAAKTWLALMLCGCIVAAVNAALGSNYLFLASPVPGTPLMLLARHGPGIYRLLLAGLCTLLLTLEGLAAAVARRTDFCKVRVKSH